MKLFIEHTDPASCREVIEIDASDPDDVAAMAALGWTPIPPVNQSVSVLGKAANAAIDAGIGTYEDGEFIGAKETPTGERWPEGNGGGTPTEADLIRVNDELAREEERLRRELVARLPEGAVSMPTVIKPKLHVKPADPNDADTLEVSNAGVTRSSMVGEVTVHETFPEGFVPSVEWPRPAFASLTEVDAGANGKVVKPCPAHGSGPPNVNCSACEAWGKRDVPAGEVPDLDMRNVAPLAAPLVAGLKADEARRDALYAEPGMPSKKPSEWIDDYIRNRYGNGPAGVHALTRAVVAYLDAEREGKP